MTRKLRCKLCKKTIRLGSDRKDKYYHNKCFIKKFGKSKEKKYRSIDDVRCPICSGVINHKWFNFRGEKVVEFVAECWSGSSHDEKPRHIFYFQIEVPECVLIYNEENEN